MRSSRIQEYKDTALDTVDALSNRAKNAAHDFALNSRGFADKVVDWTETGKENAVAAFDEGSTRTRAFVKNRPVLSVALLLGITAVAAYWFSSRSSDHE